MRPEYELSDILYRYGEQFHKERQVLRYHSKVLHAIQYCRTSRFGGHVERCNECGEERIAYNSCRNRHCPKCQGSNRDRWIAARQKDLLDCKYYHVVFTLPEAVNTFCLHYPRKLYDMLFYASKDTLMTFGRDEKHLGAEMGVISVLHTWGQNLSLHPHVHMIVPAGGVDKSGKWIQHRKNGKYLFPVKAMSKVYRGKFMERFRHFMAEKGMEITPDLHQQLYAKDWVVFAKKPFGGAKQVIEYLGRYTHKVAISNHRLKRIDNGKVTFSYKDYRQGGKKKVMTLDAMEFLRRFCMHVLPRGFRKIRHYGLLSSQNKGKLRALQKEMEIVPDEDTISFYKKLSGTSSDSKRCPCCKKGEMEQVFSFRPHAPPILNQCRSSRKLLRNKEGK